MKIDWAFLRLVLYCLTGVAAFIVFPLSMILTGEAMRSVAAGLAMSTMNLLLGYLAIEYSFERSNTTFLKIVLGGMALRMMVLLGLVVLLIRIYGFHTLSLMIALLVFYILNLVLEIHFLQKKVSLKK